MAIIKPIFYAIHMRRRLILLALMIFVVAFMCLLVFSACGCDVIDVTPTP
jgi:hypothetical protein